MGAATFGVAAVDCLQVTCLRVAACACAGKGLCVMHVGRCVIVVRAQAHDCQDVCVCA